MCLGLSPTVEGRKLIEDLSSRSRTQVLGSRSPCLDNPVPRACAHNRYGKRFQALLCGKLPGLEQSSVGAGGGRDDSRVHRQGGMLW